MSQPVFISYARDASRGKAEALHEALGGRTAFLDTADIASGEEFPKALVDALFDARVVVIFAEPQYFTRWYCLLEFRIARTPFLRAVERPGATAQEKADALRGLVVAMPSRRVDPMMERFPPLVRGRNWPDVDDIERIAELVEAELAANPPPLRERYAWVADADAARSFLLEATRLPPPLRIGNIPFVPQTGLAPTIRDAFVGRGDDLWRIHDMLWTERGDPATAAGLTGAIEATGGFGKTRLALEYLYRFGPRHFKGGLFWIDAESDPELQLYDVLQALNPSVPAIEVVRQGSGGVSGAVARAIRSRSDNAATPLFIIDNVPEPEPDQPPKPLEAWCPVLGEVPVLTTSRTRVALGAGGSVVALPIDTLDPASAVELLTTDVRRDALQDAGWKHIAEWVGHLPLALEVLNRLLRSGEMTSRTLLDLSREQRPSAAVDAAMNSIRSVVPEGALRGITEAFSASYNLLTPEEQYAARLIAWMAPAAIPAFVIDAFGRESFPDGVRSKLRHRSFVTAADDGSSEFLGSMHRVLADFLRVQSATPETEAETVASLLTELLNSAQGRGVAGSLLVREGAPLVLSVFANWITYPTSATDFSQTWRFANNAGVILGEWGYMTFAGDLFSALASASGRRLGYEHPDTLTVMNNLANTQLARGDYTAAQELLESVLKARRQILGDEHSHSLASMSSLALTRRAMWDHAGAQELQEHVLESMRRIMGPEHPDTLSEMNNLAITRRVRRDFSGAQELLQVVLEKRRQILGPEHPDTLASMTNLGNTLFEQSDFSETQKIQERVLAVMSRILGDEHPDTLKAMNNLAITRSAAGHHTEAQRLQERVVEVRRRILGKEHPDTLNSMNSLAATLRLQGDHARARDIQEMILETMQRVFGSDHPRTLISMYNLALTRKDQGDHKGLKRLQEQTLEAMQSRLGLEHPWTTKAALGLLRTYSDEGDFDSANLLIRKSLLWLLVHDPAALSDEQRQLQIDLRLIFDWQIDRSPNTE